MAKSTDVRSLVERFAQDLQALIDRNVNQEFAARFDELKERILGGATRAPASRAPAREAARAPARGGGRPAKAAAGRRASLKADLKPCPVCGTPNKARRFSYLCEKHRSAENLAKFKGASRGVAAANAGRRTAGKTAGRKGKRAAARKPASTPTPPAPTTPPAGT